MTDQRGNIAEFNAPTGGFHADDAGARALSEAGYTEDRYYRQAGEDYKQAGDTIGKVIENHEYMSEVSQGAAASAAMLNNQTQTWNQQASQPDAANDKDLQKKFMEDSLEPQLQKFQSAFATERGQQWAMGQADQIRQHFYEKTSGDMINLAANQRVENAKTMMNQYSATVARDPTAADAAMSGFSSYVSELRKDPVFASAEGSIQLNKLNADGLNELAKTQVKALADNGNPAAALNVLNSGAHDANIPAPEQSELRKYIETSVRMRQADQDHAYIQQQRQQALRDENFSNQILGTIKADPKTGNVVIPPNAMSAIFSAPGPEQGGPTGKTKVEVMGLVNKVATETSDEATPNEVSEQNTRDLFSRLTLPPGDPNKITDMSTLMNAYTKGDINWTGFQRVSKIYDQYRGPDNENLAKARDGFLKFALPQIDQSSMLKNDPLGKQNAYSYQWFVDDQVAAYKKANKDPEDLFNPSKPDYLGKPEVLSQFQPSVAQTAKAQADRIRNAGATVPSAVSAPAPSLDTRVVGKTYPTPKGDMVWTTKGWVPPKAKGQ